MSCVKALAYYSFAFVIGQTAHLLIRLPVLVSDVSSSVQRSKEVHPGIFRDGICLIFLSRDFLEIVWDFLVYFFDALVSNLKIFHEQGREEEDFLTCNSFSRLNFTNNLFSNCIKLIFKHGFYEK